MGTQALAKAEPPAPGGSLIYEPDLLLAKMKEWQEHGYHILSPATKILGLAPSHGINVSVVLLDSRVDGHGVGSDVYYSKQLMEKDERAIGKHGLNRISQSAGISWDPNASRRTDPRTVRYLWEYQSVGTLLSFDGTPLTIKGTKEVDLRDGSPQIDGWSPKRLLMARQFGLELAETKSQLRAVRSIGVRHKYTAAELARPFIVIRVAYVPDMADPEIRRIVATRAMSGVRALYPGGGGPALVADQPDPTDRSDPSPEEPEPPDDAVYVTEVVEQASGTDRDGVPWQRFVVTTSDGGEYLTFDADLVNHADQCRQDKTPIRARFKTTDHGQQLEALTDLSKQPALKL